MSETDSALEGIAIVGMSGRFPGAPDINTFWRNLLNREETISTVTGAELPGDGLYVPRRGLLEKPEWFDAAFFGISPREAEVMDPQQRVFLEECWNALEDAGCDPTRYAGAIGVFAGMSNNTYWAQNVAHHPELTASVGWLTAMMANEKDYLATRVAYKLNLRGPALSIYTACSTSLVAVCQAVQGLLNYTCDVALAGGISITFPHERGYRYDEGGILSPDGHCRAFDSQAGGTVFSNGVGVVTLKRLVDAIADKDQIYAVIKGAALNNDGSNKVSFTAPSVEGHAEVISLAHALAGFDPRTIGYVEAHGTGTPLGDPIEIAGLTQAFRAGTEDRNYCAIGSVKTNIGHLDAAAGIAGLIKAALAVKHGQIPASLHFSQPNPALRLDESPFFVAAQTHNWLGGGERRRAGVSSFGVGGTNAHVVLEEPPVVSARISGGQGQPYVLPLSAKSETAVAERANQLANFLEASPLIDLRDVAFTLNSGRAAFAFRRAVVCTNRENAIAALRGLDSRRSFNGRAVNGGVVFMFPGQGAQYPRMGAQLYAREAVFREAFDECCAILEGQINLRDALLPGEGNAEAAAAALRETRLTQPAIFAISYAMARLCMFRGVKPAACIGHSVGEYVAAVLAGVFTLRDGLNLVAARARLVQEQPHGSMLAARLSETEGKRLLSDRVSLAAVNGPDLIVLAGPNQDIALVEAQLLAEGIACKPLETSHAFHSAMMDPVVAPLAELAAGLDRQTPKLPIYSCVTGTWLSDADAVNPQYWARHARETVRFAPSIAALLASEHSIFLECGPGQTLTQLARQHRVPNRHVTASMRDGTDESISFCSALAQLWSWGVEVDLQAAGTDEARRISLPTYPFERQRYFADAPVSVVTDAPSTPPLPIAADLGSPTAPASPEAAIIPSTAANDQTVEAQVIEELQRLSGIELDKTTATSSFIELGFDSLFLTQVAVAAQKRFGIKVTFRQLLQELTSPAELARHLQANGATAITLPAPAKSNLAPASVAAPRPHRAHGPFRGIDATHGGELLPIQREHLANLIASYTAKTAGSKRYTAQHRKHLADPRAVAGFRREWKELVYPLVCDRSEGARIWDVDNNEYIDVTLGFGQILFGHRMPFLVKAVEEQLHRGIAIGPTAPKAGELAERLSRFLNFERVAFCNTGSEAVAAALRVARTVTGRDQVAVFAGAYHGIFDEVLYRPGPAPIAPGIPESAVRNLVVLDYGTDKAIEWLRANGAQLAAVLVEPVQSRHPALAPREFLKELRSITQQCGAALIFDEIVTGFRLAPRGAQEHFDIRADIATYGKVIGGGMPVGIVAGISQYMDALDGGAWHYGDESFPEVGVTFFAGTFVRHPLALAAVSAVLDQLEAEGPALQRTLAEKTATLVGAMNTHLETCATPIRWEICASLYHLPLPPELRFAPLIFTHMRERGIHAWENRPCFLSAAHTESDIARIAVAFCESVNELIDAQLLPGAVSPITAGLLQAHPLPAGELTPRLDSIIEVVTPASELVAQQTETVEEARVEAPVSDAQREILHASIVSEEANCAFNDSIALRIHGAVDSAKFENALAKLVARHEALRTSFAPDLSVQSVHPAVAMKIDFRDISQLSEDEKSGVLKSAEERQAVTPFALQSSPLWRAELFKIAAEEFEFRFTAHHAICDGWSFGVIAAELAELYRKGESPLPSATSLRVQIADQEQHQSSAEFAKSEAWWIEQFTPPPPLLDLPLDGTRATKRNFQAATGIAEIPADTVDATRKAASALKTTPFAILLGTFAILLRRLSGQADIVIGVASAGQATLESPLVGHCVSFLPIRLRADETQTFGTLASATADRVLDAQEHSDVTFGRLLQKLTLPRDPGRMPLTSVSFNVDRAPHDLSFGNATAEFRPLPKHRYHLELSLNLVECDGGYRVFCHFNRSLFAPDTIERWLSNYVALLQAGVASPEKGILDLPILSEAEYEQVVFKWNETASPYPRDEGIDTLFEAVAASRPDALAIVENRKTVTYTALNFQANLLAERLLETGSRPGSLIGICTERSIEFIVACLAAVKVGAAYVPLDPSWPAERLESMARAAKLSLVITKLEHARHFPGNVVLLDGPKRIEISAGADPDIPTTGQTPAYVIFTSGSTGTPKGVVVPHRAISRLVLQTDYVQLAHEDVVGHASNPAFDAATFEIWGALLNGAQIVILPKATMLDATVLGDTLAAEGITTLFVTTPLFNQLAGAAPDIFKTLKHLLVGGDVANAALMARVLEAGAPERFLNIYGPTEVTTFACAHLVTSAPEKHDSVPIGKAIANTRAYILGEGLQPVPIGVPGELYLGGDGVALGYHGSEELTAKYFLADPFHPDGRIYRTGDRARWRADGEIEFLGRIDGQTKLRGFRVELGEIEAELSRHPGIRESAVRVLGDSPEDKSLAAYFIPANGHALEPNELRAFLTRRLPDYMIPRVFVPLRAFPLTPNGKVDRRALPDPAVNTVVVAPPASASPTEQRIAGLMAATLGQPNVGIEDDFFRLGGHSLLAMDLMARLRKAFGVEIPPSVLFETPNVQGIAKFIEEHLPKPAERSDFRFLVPIQRGVPGKQPLFLVAGGWGGEIEFLVYAQIGRLLGTDQPIWGLKARGAGTAEPPHRTVSEMAADYLVEIRTLQPVGPYSIAGECVGGICAHEIACQLRDSGEQVRSLILLDTSVPNADELADYIAEEERKKAAEVTKLSFRERVRHHWKELASRSVGGKFSYLLKKAARKPVDPEPAAEQHPRGQAQYPPTLMRHRLRPYPGRVTLLVDEESYALHGQLGWENVPTGDLELHVLPGDHLTYIREEGPHAAQKLREILSETLQRR